MPFLSLSLPCGRGHGPGRPHSCPCCSSVTPAARQGLAPASVCAGLSDAASEMNCSPNPICHGPLCTYPMLFCPALSSACCPQIILTSLYQLVHTELQGLCTWTKESVNFRSSTCSRTPSIKFLFKSSLLNTHHIFNNFPPHLGKNMKIIKSSCMLNQNCISVFQ